METGAGPEALSLIFGFLNRLTQEDANVIVVDWASGAKSPYLQATANARLVGRQLSRIVDYLKTKGLVIGNVQVLAHSLGAPAP